MIVSLLFFVFLALSIYLFFRAARLLLARRYRVGLFHGCLSIAPAGFSVYFGVVLMNAPDAESLMVDEIIRSVFHIEIWPWLVPIAALAILFFWLAGLSFRAYRAQALGRVLALSVVSILTLIPLGYVTFVLCFFVLFSGPPKTEAEMIKDFEVNTGLTYPESAKVLRHHSDRSDAFGDWQGALAFEVPLAVLDQYRALPEPRWGDQPQWQVWYQANCCDGILRNFPAYQPPDGALFVLDDSEVYRFVALSHDTGAVYYVRASW